MFTLTEENLPENNLLMFFKKTCKMAFKAAVSSASSELRRPPELQIYKVRRGKWERSALVLEMLDVSLKILGMHSSVACGTFNSRCSPLQLKYTLKNNKYKEHDGENKNKITSDSLFSCLSCSLSRC